MVRGLFDFIRSYPAGDGRHGVYWSLTWSPQPGRGARALVVWLSTSISIQDAWPAGAT